jgi:hypothetical protein
MNNNRDSEIARIWDEFIKIAPTPLNKIKGGRGEYTELYNDLFKSKGVYVVRNKNGEIVYIGIAGGGEKEGGLADRLSTHIEPASALRRRLKKQQIDIDECTIAIYSEEDKKKRRRLEMYGIAVFDPVGNVD